ncbi:MAG TPA: PocR ligand-binding domain-containing protein, partial [Tepidisphaeraceae bacterium]|nr:PocR ligand-binding domain-containing protein [Tepidisphaeraceae bacterium]
MPTIDHDNLRLTDFMDLATLQEIQDSFAAVAHVKATITDADGTLLTAAQPSKEFLIRQRALADADEHEPEGPQREGREYVAPIMVNNVRLGTIRMASNGTAGGLGLDDAKLSALAEKFGVDARQMKSLATQLTRSAKTRPAAVQFLFLLANAIARLCYQEYQLRQRINELTAVYNVTTMLADARDLQKVLQRTVRVVTEVMGTKAASIRLIDGEKDLLVIKAVHNLSQIYQNKGPVP